MIVKKNLHQNSFLIIVHGFFFSLLAKPFYLLAKYLFLSKTFIYFWQNFYPSTKHMTFHGKPLLLGKTPIFSLLNHCILAKPFISVVKLQLLVEPLCFLG
jgi:hypothetical protein